MVIINGAGLKGRFGWAPRVGRVDNMNKLAGWCGTGFDFKTAGWGGYTF